MFGLYTIYLLTYVGNSTDYQTFVNSFQNQDLLMVVNSVGCLIDVIIVLKFIIPFLKVIYNALKFHSFKGTKED